MHTMANRNPFASLQSVAILLLLFLSRLSLIKSFQRFARDHKSTRRAGRWHRAKIPDYCQTISLMPLALFNQQTQHDEKYDDQSNRELKFHMMNLLKIDDESKAQSEKIKFLSSIIQSCNSVLEDEDEVERVRNKEVELVNLPEKLSTIRRFINTSSRFNDHRSCFRVFSGEDNKVSLTANVLLSLDRPFTFLRDTLSHQSDASEKKRGGMMYDGTEAVVWCSSLTSDQDLKFSSCVMDDMPFSQLYLGVCHDDDYLDVELDMESVSKLESLGVLISGQKVNDDSNSKHKFKIKTDDLNVIQTIVSDALKDEQQTLIKLIDAAVELVRRDPLNESNEPHLVLLSHCVSCSVIASAISAWKEEQQQNEHSRHRSRLEDLLHQAVTVVTFGNVCRSFCDGPAYIHISMWDDPWNKALGAHSGNDESSGGQNAVYFHAWSPYDQEWEDTNIHSLKSHNAHNVNSCLIQYLCLIMRINGIQSFRALYDAARFIDPAAILDINPKHFAVSYRNNLGELVIPPRIDDELLPAMIYATGGDQWLWGNDDKSHFDEVLPDEIEARSHLEESFGYSVFEEIRETCSEAKAND
ncbi:hypothetical protein ACHAXM_003914 [Skeletonema potamos]